MARTPRSILRILSSCLNKRWVLKRKFGGPLYALRTGIHAILWLGLPLKLTATATMIIGESWSRHHSVAVAMGVVTTECTHVFRAGSCQRVTYDHLTQPCRCTKDWQPTLTFLVGQCQCSELKCSPSHV
jgi:hypothetical protein